MQDDGNHCEEFTNTARSTSAKIKEVQNAKFYELEAPVTFGNKPFGENATIEESHVKRLRLLGRLKRAIPQFAYHNSQLLLETYVPGAKCQSFLKKIRETRAIVHG